LIESTIWLMGQINSSITAKEEIMTTETMTNEELMALVKQQSEAIAMLQAQKTTPKTTAKTIIKVNAKNGIFIRDDRFKAFSDKTGKEYTASLNIHNYQLSALQTILSDKKLQKEILNVMKTGKEYRA